MPIVGAAFVEVVLGRRWKRGRPSCTLLGRVWEEGVQEKDRKCVSKASERVNLSP